MQTSNSTRVQFLEDWLRTTAIAAATGGDSRPPPTPPPAATAILQAWSELRDPSTPTPSHSHRLLAALRTLTASPSSLHVADPQAKLLLSLLSSSPPAASVPLLLRLLYIYLRKSPRPSPALLSSAASLLPALLTPSPISILLLGALSAAPALPLPVRSASLDHLCQLLDEMPDPDPVPEFLAGIGYALSVADPLHFTRILASGILYSTRWPHPTIAHGLMILRVVEWCVSVLIRQKSVDRLELLCTEISPEKGYARFAVVMAAAGVLRAIRMVGSSGRIRAMSSVEGSIGFVAMDVVSGKVDGGDEHRLLLQCVALGMVRCGAISFSRPVLICLFLVLSSEIFPLPSFFRRAIGFGECEALGLKEVKEHLNGILFKEAGAVTGILCNQYGLADEESKVVVENHMWEYSQELYRNFRVAALVHRRKNDELLENLERIAEAAFLMIVVFAAEVSKQKVNLKSYPEVRLDAAVKILVAFSCIEYLRRVRLPEYTDAVRSAILTIQEDAALSASFAESMPPYTELTGEQGIFGFEGRKYHWTEDEVQTARVLFYLRVIPTSITLIPALMFGNIVAPTMFLYMQHPNEKVARASHSVFVAFISSGKDPEHDDGLTLKEKLVFYYMERALEAYPGVTPFEGLASGVAALVRHLPAGSPSIFYCVHSLVGRATLLSRKATTQDATIWKNWEGSSDPCKKVLDLILRLIYLVDIQVFPYLLKQLAEFIVQLPKDGQYLLLDEMYSQVAESDDVTRKPVLVSWLQSLSYICSRKAPSATSAVDGGDVETRTGSISSNGGSFSRL